MTTITEAGKAYWYNNRVYTDKTKEVNKMGMNLEQRLAALIEAGYWISIKKEKNSKGETEYTCYQVLGAKWFSGVTITEALEGMYEHLQQQAKQQLEALNASR